MNLFGRDAELKLVREHLRAGKNLAVCGPAGVGKTALVRAALSHGNPGRIVTLCQQAKQGHYIFGRHLDTRLLDLDRRIKNLNLP
jgi:MoxR-like ATPase